jgi:ectoine hydroxylase-related dioxygenase (phytanoyl-CoA dioxygenase family)
MDALSHRTGVVTADICAEWLNLIDRSYAAVGTSRHDDKNFSARSSSMRLFSISGIDLEAVRRAISGNELPTSCERALGAAVACDLDQCWVRRQYPPAKYPSLHAPHSWHQDGALHFDFRACSAEQRREGVLDMITCWIPLTPCGIDAPGLELIERQMEGLLPPPHMTDQYLREQFSPEEFQQPAMQPGDALLFRGGILHRTHVTAQMTKVRTSIELRLFVADRIPERLRDDRFCNL